MKILFVCKGNNCRSQMAEAIYNRLTNSNHASSAGTRVESAGQTLEAFNNQPDVSSSTIDAMRDAGYDVSQNLQTQLTPGMLSQYDIAISMAAKRYTPAWLVNAPNYVYWKIPDPHGRGYAITKRAKDAIEQKISELLATTSDYQQ